jgi:hypothetical protein
MHLLIRGELLHAHLADELGVSAVFRKHVLDGLHVVVPPLSALRVVVVFAGLLGDGLFLDQLA